MKGHNIFKVLLVTVLGVSPILGQAEAILGKQLSKKQVAVMQQNQAMMSPEEQQFAMKLSMLHKQIFTMVFTPDLRKEAMSLVSMPSEGMDDDTPMTPDMAVEEVISNHRDIPAGAMPSKTSQKKGGAPTKKTKNSNNHAKKNNYWRS